MCKVAKVHASIVKIRSAMIVSSRAVVAMVSSAGERRIKAEGMLRDVGRRVYGCELSCKVFLEGRCY